MRPHLLPLLLCLAAPAAADTAFLINGARQEGVFAGIKNGKVILKTGKKQNLIPRSKVASLSFARDNEPELETRIFQSNNVPAGGRLYEETYRLNDKLNSQKVVHAVTPYNLRYDFTYLEGYQTAKIEYARSFKGNSIVYSDTSWINSQKAPYDFLHRLFFEISGTTATNYAEYRYTITSLEHYRSFPFAGSFDFSSGIGNRQIVRVEIPLQRKLNYDTAAIKSGLKFEETTTKTKRIYSWEASTPGLVSSHQVDPDSRGTASSSYLLLFAIDDTWANIQNFMSAQIDKRLDAEKELSALAAKIAPESLPGDKRLKLLSDWINSNVEQNESYMGEAPYMPRYASQIMASKIGNHLDKPFLLYALLKSAGFKCSLLYAGRADVVMKVPTVTQFIQAAVLVSVNGSEILLPEAALPGRMFIVHGQPEKLFYVNASPRYRTVEVKQTVSLTPSGQIKAFTENWLKAERQFDVTYSTEILKDSNGLGNIYATSEFMSYQPKIGYLPDWPQEITKPLVFANNQETETRTADIAIPEGFQPYRLPQNAFEEVTCCSYKITYSIQGGTIHLQDTFQRNHGVIFPSDYPAARELLLKRRAQQLMPVIFIKSRAAN